MENIKDLFADNIEDWVADIKELGNRFSKESWDIRSYKEIDTTDGYAFVGHVFYEDQEVAIVENDGHGGPNTIFWIPSDSPKFLQAQALWNLVLNTTDFDNEEIVEALLIRFGY